MNEDDLEIVSLNDWVLFKHPDVYKATKYIGDTGKLTAIWTKVWRDAGCPEIRDIDYFAPEFYK